MIDSTFLITGALLLIFDFMYLSLIKGYFTKQIVIVQGSDVQPNLIAIAICYLFLIFGINYFIIKPRRSVLDAFLLGLVIYSVYETTNKALITKWSWITVFTDSLWGGILFALTTCVFYRLEMVSKYF
jgi:uncharacterized membrane protein